MPETKDFALRVELLDECFQNRQKKWTLDALIKRVNERLEERTGKTAGRRTIQGDIKYLIKEKNAPIARKREGTVTYFSYVEGFILKDLPIIEEEIILLRDAINILSQVSDFKILGEVDNIINKLQNTVHNGVTGGASYIQFEKHTVASGTGYIDDIFNAIKGKSCLRVTYQSFKAINAEQIVFHSYLLKEYRNRWFVIGRVDNTTKITNLALDRIKAIKNSSCNFVPNDLIDIGTYFSNMIGVTFPEGESVQSIEIKCKSHQAPYIRTKPIHHTQEIFKTYANGDILIRLWLINNYELRSVLLSYGADIEVIKPLALREAIGQILLSARRVYNTD